MKESSINSWGLFPAKAQRHTQPAWRDEIATLVTHFSEQGSLYLPHGKGRSYGDCCISASSDLFNCQSLDRIIAFDKDQGIIVAESGTTLEKLLSVAIPAGWFLPVTPGTKYVSLGGAVANDVHGKNHHQQGTIGNHVRRFGLYRSDLGNIECTPQENTKLFHSTIGGVGLTGIITFVELKLMKVPSANIAQKTLYFSSIKDCLQISREYDNANEYAVAWLHCSPDSPHFGEGLYFLGNHAADNDLSVSRKSALTLPGLCTLPIINDLTIKAFNALYLQKGKRSTGGSTVNYDSYFYPLDRVTNWNILYGGKGFRQFQCIFPEAVAEEATNECLNIIQKYNAGSFLVVLKRCGNKPSPGLISFPMEGISLAVDFSNNIAGIDGLMRELENIVVQARGRVYLAKDSSISAASFKQFYPNWNELEIMRDKNIKSALWERLASV